MRSQTRNFFMPGAMFIQFQSTGSMRSQTRHTSRQIRKVDGFNPLAPCGARHKNSSSFKICIGFQSTGSMRSQTCFGITADAHFRVSIHWLHAEPDRWQNPDTQRPLRFNPLAPCGARRSVVDDTLRANVVSIHWLHAEPDLDQMIAANPDLVSIHWLHAEPDPGTSKPIIGTDVSIHWLHAEPDIVKRVYCVACGVSIHWLHAEPDRERK